MKMLLNLCVFFSGLALMGIVIGLALLSGNADGVLKGPLERAFSFATKAEVTLESVWVSLLGPRIEIQGLTLHNPPEFKTGPAVRFRRVALDFSLGSLLSRRPTLRRLLLDEAEVNLRYELGEGTNLGRLAKNASGEKRDGKASSPDPSASSEARGGLVIKELRCERARVSVSTNLVPLVSAAVEVSPFSLSDVGDKPITTAQVTGILLRTLLKETITGKGLLKPLAALIQKEVNELTGE